ncbi:hypothetical protein M0R89_02955 [Halorussus limi]|uniref:Uncharacterized protein n=1 Tax=Halorussus limi TaxID=2938695 RepID=A0A8U0HWR8_9EURY|nr:hypothetical protein [Halorussus limi]UPV75034.1 hypothetical protein M0R89_02955 [Halorussus limi]
MTRKATLLAVSGAGLTVAALVAVGGAGVAVFLFFAAGLLLAALFGEAGTSPAPEGAGPSPEGDGGDGMGETLEYAEQDGSPTQRGRSVDWGSVALAYVAGLCLSSVGALIAIALS